MEGKIYHRNEYTVACGCQCGLPFIKFADDEAHFKRMLRCEGWVIRNRLWVCPKCLSIFEKASNTA